MSAMAGKERVEAWKGQKTIPKEKTPARAPELRGRSSSGTAGSTCALGNHSEAIPSEGRRLQEEMEAE